MSGLTQEQQQQFLTQGYLILSQAIPSHLVEYLARITWNRLLSEFKANLMMFQVGKRLPMLD